MAAVAFRGVQSFRTNWHWQQGARGMATLKELSIRLKSVKNIEKITKSMKMVSAAKYAQAERQLKPARTYGVAAQAVLEKAEVVEEERSENHLFVVISSDRGLCGSIHSNLARTLRPIMEQRSSSANTYFVCVGDKVRTILQRTMRDNLFMTFNEVGKKPPVFVESTAIAHAILNSGLEFGTAEIVYNRFKNVISYQTTLQPFVPLKTLTESENLLLYDDVDADVLQCYHEMTWPISCSTP
ncbi:ATP synthase subunit gamma, mitochondrial [Geodia barretti]|uniref:F-ATPase gamma subunit n=1 Tax=Geodia barretti TaxID=519541 RepID=A0AA35TBB3_GEOBA|nr:ATP synthase subunit gamma, mitochondrial [Geodia barretti]